MTAIRPPSAPLGPAVPLAPANTSAQAPVGPAERPKTPTTALAPGRPPFTPPSPHRPGAPGAHISPLAGAALPHLADTAQQFAGLAEAASNDDAKRILGAAAQATARIAKQLTAVGRVVLHSQPAKPQSITGTMERRARDGAVVAWFRPDDPTLKPFALPLESVLGLRNGAALTLKLEARDQKGQVYSVRARPEAYASAMLARIARDAEGGLVAEGSHVTSAYPSLPLRGPALDGLVGKTVVVAVDAARTARVLEVVDHPERLQGRFLAIAVEHGVTLGRSEAALAQLEALIAAPPIHGPDLTHLPFVTIDNPTSKDLDQALYIERRPDQGFTLHYAIADIAAFLPEGSPLDQEALTRSFTTYLPHTALPMLPKELCEDLISLNPNVPRRAFVATVEFDKNGVMGEARFARGVIKSRAKLSYGQVQRHLDMGARGELHGTSYSASLELLKTLGALRIELARKRGVVDANSARASVTHTQDGFTLAAPLRFMTERYNEQISVAVNEAVGAFLQARGIQTLHRVELPPDEGKLIALRARVAALGIPWPDGEPLADYIDRLDPKDTRTLPIKRMATYINRRATYDIEPLGHYALRLPAYDHFTAPMRRYSDVITHRVLAAVVEGTPVPYQAPGALDAVMQELDAAQKRNAKINRDVEALVTREVVRALTGQTRQATVVDVHPSGATVRLSDPPCEVPLEAALLRRLTGMNYVLTAQSVALSNGAHTLRIGDTLEVTLLGVDEKERINVAPTTLVQAQAKAAG